MVWWRVGGGGWVGQLRQTRAAVRPCVLTPQKVKEPLPPPRTCGAAREWQCLAGGHGGGAQADRQLLEASGRLPTPEVRLGVLADLQRTGAYFVKTKLTLDNPTNGVQLEQHRQTRRQGDRRGRA